MHLHAIVWCEQRRIDGVNSTPSSRRSYRYSTASMARGGQMGRRAADRARSSRRRRGAGGRFRRPLSSLCFICGAREAACRFFGCKLHALLTASQAECSVHSLQALSAQKLLRITALVCVRQQDNFNLAIGRLVGACTPAKKRATTSKHDRGNAACYAKQQHSTSPEGRYLSQPVAARTQRCGVKPA